MPNIYLETKPGAQTKVDLERDARILALTAEANARSLALVAEAEARSLALGVEAAARMAGDAAAVNASVRFVQAAMSPDLLIVGMIVRDASGAVTSAPVVWPDGKVGTYTATTVSTAFPGAVDAYTITYGSPVTATYTQPACTRDPSGAVTIRPAMTVT